MQSVISFITAIFMTVLCALVPFAGLLLVPRTPAALIVGAIPCVYAAIMLISGRFFFEQWQFKRELKAVFAGAGILLAAFALVSIIRLNLVENGIVKDPAVHVARRLLGGFQVGEDADRFGFLVFHRR